MATTYKEFPNPVLWRANVRPFKLTSGMLPPANLLLRKGTIISPLGDIMYKSGKVSKAVTAGTAVELYKDHSFAVGDAYFDGATEREVTAIDNTTYTTHDVLTLDDVTTNTLNEVVYSTASGAVATSGLAIIAEDVIYDSISDVINVTISDKCLLDLSRMPNYWALALTGDLKTV